MIIAGLTLLGAGGFLFLNDIDALPDHFSFPFLPAQKVINFVLSLSVIFYLQKKDSLFSSPKPVLVMTSSQFEPPPLRPQFGDIIDYSKAPGLHPLRSSLNPLRHTHEGDDSYSEITRD